MQLNSELENLSCRDDFSVNSGENVEKLHPVKLV
jgi:hypothetical protein